MKETVKTSDRNTMEVYNVPTLRRFSAQSDSDLTIVGFLQLFLSYVSAIGKDNEWAKRNVSLHMDRPAIDWFNLYIASHINTSTWEQVKEQLISLFQHRTIAVLSKVYDRRQGDEESVADYADDMANLFAMSNFPASSISLIFIAGLRSGLKLMIPTDSHTLPMYEVVQHACVAETRLRCIQEERRKDLLELQQAIIEAKQRDHELQSLQPSHQPAMQPGNQDPGQLGTGRQCTPPQQHWTGRERAPHRQQADRRRRDAPPARARARTPGEDVRFYRKMLNHLMTQNERLQTSWATETSDQGNE
jgi:hypothetical protein